MDSRRPAVAPGTTRDGHPASRAPGPPVPEQRVTWFPGGRASAAHLSPRHLLAVQSQAGNAAATQLLGRSSPRERPPGPAVVPSPGEPAVQRDPPTPSNIAPLPGSDTPPPPAKSGWDAFKAIVNGDRKFRFGAGTHNLYRSEKSRDFSWSTKKPGPQAETVLTLGVLPFPLPIGPLLVQATAGMSAYAGGNALFDVTLKDVILEATAADLMKVGQAVAFLMLPGAQLASLAVLASLNLRGTGTLIARAEAGLEAGADAEAKAVANSAIWPVAPYIGGSVGGLGRINAKAAFELPAQVTFSGGRLRLTAGQTFRTYASLSAELGLRAALYAGIKLGYGPFVTDKRLWSHATTAMVAKEIKGAVSGGNWATMTSSDDGLPVIDMERVVVNATALVQALFQAREAGRDTVAPPETDVRAPARGIGAVQTHGRKKSSNRTGPELQWTESEHIVPYACGARLWEVIGLVVPGRGGHEDRGQTTIMIYEKAARFKTEDDLVIIRQFESVVHGANAPERMRRARVHIDAGHPEAARSEVAAVLGLMTAGLRSIRSDAVSRTIGAIARESQMHMNDHPETNAERRGPLGHPEPRTPEPGAVAAASNTQYADILALATEAVESANLLR